MELESQIRTELKKLLVAITHQNYDGAMKAHKALYKMGSPTIPFVTDTLLGLDLSHATVRVKSTVEMRYVTSLVSLIHDIDENESKKVTQQLIQKGCSATVKQRLNSILAFTLNDYFQYEIRGVKIFEYKKIKSQFNIQSKLERWFSNIPEDDLREIDRVYILSPTKDQENAGCYMPIFYNIELTWDVSGTKISPVTWLALFWMEIVLYHEIGHHVNKHTFGRIQKQEDEADNYASRVFFSSRPVLYKNLRVISKVVKLFRRKSIVERNHQARHQNV